MGEEEEDGRAGYDEEDVGELIQPLKVSEGRLLRPKARLVH